MVLFEELITLTPTELIYTIFIPFIIVFVIFWGILSALNVFGRKINLILAFCISAAAFSYMDFGIISTYLIAFSGNLAITAFFIIFIVGILVWSALSLSETFGSSSKNARKASEKIDKLYRELDRTRNPSKQEAIEREIEKWERNYRRWSRRERRRYR